MERKMPTLQPKIILEFSFVRVDFSSLHCSHRASGGVGGEVLEYGVGVQTTHHCHAHTVCGSWKGLRVASIRRSL